MNWALLPFKRYAQFRGRARRKEYWLYILLIVTVSVILSLIDSALGLGGRSGTYAAPAGGFGGGAYTRGGILSSVFSLLTIIPSLAVAVRRLHDTDRSGWWLLLPIVPIVILLAVAFSAIARGTTPGAGGFGTILVLGLITFITEIVLLVFLCLRGTPGPNRFGPDPLSQDPEALAETFR